LEPKKESNPTDLTTPEQLGTYEAGGCTEKRTSVDERNALGGGSGNKEELSQIDFTKLLEGAQPSGKEYSGR